MTAQHLGLPIRAQGERRVTASHGVLPKVRKGFADLAKIAIKAGCCSCRSVFAGYLASSTSNLAFLQVLDAVSSQNGPFSWPRRSLTVPGATTPAPPSCPEYATVKWRVPMKVQPSERSQPRLRTRLYRLACRDSSSFRFHWPLYIFEGAELALFMISACVFSVILFDPSFRRSE